MTQQIQTGARLSPATTGTAIGHRINSLVKELDMVMVAVPVFTADGRTTAEIRVQPR